VDVNSAKKRSSFASQYGGPILDRLKEPADTGTEREALADIHRMTGLLKPSFAQTGISCKTGPWQMASAIRQSRDVCPSLAGNVDFAFFKA
jgi:hypothetical protein